MIGEKAPQPSKDSLPEFRLKVAAFGFSPLAKTVE
jgi:hypothetical protein